MKFYPSQLDVVFNRISNGQVTSILLFGPDKGYITTTCQEIIKRLDLITTSLSYSEASGESLRILLNSQNFFNKREFIKVTSVTSSISVDLKNLLSGNFTNFIAFIADELHSGCPIRSFFETHKNLASIACYPDDQQNIAKIIQRKLTTNAKTIEKDALSYLTSSLGGDHQLVNNELDKLLSYAYDKNIITLKDAQLTITDDMKSSGDDLCVYFAEKDTEKMLLEFNKLQVQGINNILIIRALIRFYLNLYIVLSKVKEGIGMDTAMTFISPPIFYKRINGFKKIANSLEITDVIKVLSMLQQAEISFKADNKSFDFFQIMLDTLQ